MIVLKSKLTIAQFRQRLEEVVGSEMIEYLIPYNFSGKSFCGKFDDSSFSLTRNSMFGPSRQYRIKGQYTTTEDNYTEVSYRIEYPQVITYLTSIFFFLTVSVINYIGLFEKDYGWRDFLSINVMAVFMFGLNFILHKFFRSIVDERFRTELGILKSDNEED